MLGSMKNKEYRNYRMYTQVKFSPLSMMVSGNLQVTKTNLVSVLEIKINSETEEEAYMSQLNRE